MTLFQGCLLAACLTGLSPWSSSSAAALLDDESTGRGLSLQWVYALPEPSRAYPSPSEDALALGPTWPALLAQALHHAPSNRAAAAGLIAAQAQEKQAWINAWLPKVNAFANRSRQQQTYNGQQTRTPSSSVSLSATWPLWRAAERAEVAAQSAATQQSVWREKLGQQQVALSVSTAYLDGIEATQLRQLTQAQRLVLEEQWRINEKRMQGGVGTVLDVLETRTRVEQAQAALQTLDTRINNQSLLIERLTGLTVRWPLGLQALRAPHAALPRVVPSVDEALQQLAAQNPQTEEARAQWQAAQATQRARGLEQWQPNVDLVGQASRSKQTARFDGQSETQQVAAQSIGVELSWPLFTSGLQQQRSKEAAALLSQAQAQLDDAQSQASTELRGAFQTLAQTQQLIALEQQVVQTAQAGLGAVRKAFAAGIRDNIDVLNAQAQVYEAQQRLVSAVASALSTQVNILALIGALDAHTIAPLTSAFAPTLADNAPP